jgi:hypothetical protein
MTASERSSLDAVLEQARGYLEPAPADEARVASRLRAHGAFHDAPGASWAGGRSEVSVQRSRWASLVAVGSITGVLGVLLGVYFAPQLRHLAAAPWAAHSASVVASSSPVAPPVPAARFDGPIRDEPEREPVIPPTLPLMRGSGAAAGAGKGAEYQKPIRRRRTAPVRAARTPDPTVEAPLAEATGSAGAARLSLNEALQLLRHARGAVRAGALSDAWEDLETLDRAASPELLNEERWFTKIQIHCERGEIGSARQLALRLRFDNPRSIYSERLRSTCANLDTE